MTTITVHTPSFPTRAPRGATLLAAAAYRGWRAFQGLRDWIREARDAETRPSHR